MAAAEYFQQGQPPQGLHPSYMQQSRPQQMNQGAPPYPISDEPPPYSSIADLPRPHSQPPPQSRAPQGPNGYAPPMNGHYPPDKGSNLQNMYHPSDFGGGGQPYQNRPQQPPYNQPQNYHLQPGPYPPHAPGLYGNNDGRHPSFAPGPNNDNFNSQGPPRSRSHERSYSHERSHSHHRPGRHHHHHHHHHNNNNGGSASSSTNRPSGPRKKSSGVATFLGAGGGAIIGDAIFPGLGTIGGALLGGVGGHEYGKQRRSYSGSAARASRPRSYSNGEADYDDYRRGRRY